MKTDVEAQQKSQAGLLKRILAANTLCLSVSQQLITAYQLSQTLVLLSLQVEELLDTLCDAAEQQVAQLPLPTQATLALALAQLDYYHAPTYSAIAAAVLQELADKQPIDVASETQQQQQQEQRASSTNGSSTAGASGDDSSSSSKESVPARATALCELPASLVPGVLLSLSVTYSLNGHHDAALLDELADQVGLTGRRNQGHAKLLITLSVTGNPEHQWDKGFSGT